MAGKLSELWKIGSTAPTTSDIPKGGLAVDTSNKEVFSSTGSDVFKVGLTRPEEIDALGLDHNALVNTGTLTHPQLETSLDGKLPLAGGTMSGSIDFNNTQLSNVGNIRPPVSGSIRLYDDTGMLRFRLYSNGVGDILFGDKAGTTTMYWAESQSRWEFKNATAVSFDDGITVGFSKVADMAEPTELTDATTKNYVDEADTVIADRVTNLNTGQVVEAGNLYYTDVRADSRVQEAIRDDIVSYTTVYSSTMIESLIQGSLVYRGHWNATTNDPTLVDGTGVTGFFYIVDVAGTQDLGSGSIDFIVGDRVIYNGTVWNRVQSTDTANWGEIYGTLSDQGDLQAALNLKTDDISFDAHTADVANPHAVTTTQLGLENVDNTSDIDKPVSSEQNTAIENKVEWKDKWVNATYQKNDMVLDGPYTMIANTNTTDRAGIEYIGSPYFLYTGTLTDHEISAKQVIFGNRYTASTLIQLTGFRISVVAGMEYSMFIITDPLGEPIVKQIGSKFVAAQTGWLDIDSVGSLVGNGLIFDLVAYVHEPSGAPSITTLNYDYVTPNNAGDPGIGEALQANTDISNLKFHNTDNDSNNNDIFLNGLTAGDIISTGAMVWTVQSIVDEGLTVTYGVSPATQYGTDGVLPFDFETVVASPIIAGREVDANLATTTSGLYIADGAYADIISDNNQYGIDVYVQEVSKSDDWDLIAMSGNAVGGADSGTAIEIVDNLLTEDSSKALSANQGYVLDQKIIDLEDFATIEDVNNGVVGKIVTSDILRQALDELRIDTLDCSQV